MSHVVRITTKCVSAKPCNVSGVLVFSAGAETARRIPLVDGTAEVDFGAATEADVELNASGYWMPREHLTAGAASVALPVWRAATLRGRFRLPMPTIAMPRSFAVSIDSAPGTVPPTIKHGTTADCDVAPDGQWQCTLPAAALDLVMRAKRFTPHYEWDRKLNDGEVADVGDIPLHQGASVIAWLDSSTARSLKGTAIARLERMTMSGSPTPGDRLNAPVAEATFNRRAFVQLAAVPAGTYTLEISAPGFADVRLDRIVLYEGSESALGRPIRLDPPLTIRLALNPPADPTGSPWRVSIDRANPLTFRRTKIADGIAANGALEVTGQAPGHYFVAAKDRNGNVYANRELEISSETQTTIDIGAVRLRGRVFAAGQPIAAQLVFGGRNGAERVSAVADKDGAFTVVLPRIGKWIVDVQAESDAVVAAVSTAIVENQDEIRIDLPDTEIGGWVTGLDGRRFADAIVTIYTTAGAVTQRAASDGTFRFRGISAGVAKITAGDPHTPGHSRFMELQISDGMHRDDVELALQNMAVFRGTVVSEGQPLIGARVTGYGLGTGVARQERAVTGLDGGFELWFPASATEIALIVAAPGRTLQAFTAVASDEKVMFDVAPSGGVLRLKMPPGASTPYVTYDGAPIPMPELIQWARATGSSSSPGETLSIPSVAPGMYRFCFAKNGADVCRDGTLAAGGVLPLGGD